MQKKGMTLIELIVAMSIFVIVLTLAIGGFVSISRSRILIGNMKDTQQKIRIANEMIVRYAKQAEYVFIDPNTNGKTLELYFDLPPKTPSAIKFQVTGASRYDLSYSKCSSVNSDGMGCTTWTTPVSLLGSQNTEISLANSNVFGLNGYLPAVLTVNLEIQNSIPGFGALSDAMRLENAIILESIK